MKIKGKRTKIEYLDVEIDKDDLFNHLYKALGFSKWDFIKDGIYYDYTGDNHHNGDPEYDERKATIKELNNWDALISLKNYFYKNE